MDTNRSWTGTKKHTIPLISLGLATPGEPLGRSSAPAFLQTLTYRLLVQWRQSSFLFQRLLSRSPSSIRQTSPARKPRLQLVTFCHRSNSSRFHSNSVIRIFTVFSNTRERVKGLCSFSVVWRIFLWSDLKVFRSSTVCASAPESLCHHIAAVVDAVSKALESEIPASAYVFLMTRALVPSSMAWNGSHHLGSLDTTHVLDRQAKIFSN